MTMLEKVRQDFEEWERRREWIRTADAHSINELYESRKDNLWPRPPVLTLQQTVAMKKENRFPTKASDVPATQGMLNEVRYELKAEIRAFEKRMSAQFKGLESKFSGLESKMETTLAAVEEIKMMVSQSLMMKETDYSMNRSVMDGYAHVSEEIKDLRVRVEKLEQK